MIVGIDLGTTNSLVAIWKDGMSRLIPNALGQFLTPSVVGVDDNGAMLVGMAARERLITHPTQSAATFKRYMGTHRPIQLGTRAWRAEELSSLVLRSLRADAEAYLGEPVDEAIITVPAYFSDAQRKATRIAGQLAGLKVERLLNEPTAAALAYGLHRADKETKFLVFDLGGGTFDVSILELFEGVMEVRASAGDNFLGGEDFVDAIMAFFTDAVAKEVELPSRERAPGLHQSLRDQAERAKRRLSEKSDATISVRFEERELTRIITAQDFEDLVQPLLQRLRRPVERALRDARIPANKLDAVVLAGGATRMPCVRSLAVRMFGRFPEVDLNPDEVVALGAAVQAGLKMNDAALDEIVMTDVCPYTLGVEVSARIGHNRHLSGHYMPVIERNTIVPVSRVCDLYPLKDNQTALVLNIYQGESRFVKENIFLGRIELALPPRPAQEMKIEVRYTYDVNGILEVEAHIPLTGANHRLVIENNPGVMTPEQIEQRLKELTQLKIHPRDQAENRAVMARAGRVYEELLGDAREILGEHIAIFVGLLERQDPREIAERREALAALLDQLEGESYL